MATHDIPATGGYVELHLLNGGSAMPLEMIFIDGGAMKPYKMYDWAFYIHHPKLNRHFSGIWEWTASKYTPGAVKLYFDHFLPQSPRQSLTEQLAKLNVKEHEVDSVIFSHAHWDHCRPIREIFPEAKSYFGPGTKEFCSPGHFKDPTSQFDGNFFDPEKASEKWSELDGPWVPFGSFDRAMDFFGDGSIWIVQAPGHMPVNLFAAAGVERDEWVVLGGDCCHARTLPNGTRNIAEFVIPGTDIKRSAHHDLITVKKTIASLRQLELDHGMHIALAHDEMWIREGTDPVLMAMLDDEMKAFVRERLAGNSDP